MELRVLRYFLVVAEEGNMTRASERLHVGQPTLSRQIKELERELGQSLFVRRSHGLALTDSGQLLLAHAVEMSELADKIEKDFSTMCKRPFGDVRVGGAETVQIREFAKAMRMLKSEYPEVVIRYEAGNLDDVAVRLDRGLLDFALLSQPANLDKYDGLVFPGREEWKLYVRPDNPLAAKSCITNCDLAKEPLIMSAQIVDKRAFENNVAEWFGDKYGDLNIAATFNLAYSGAQFVKEGLGSMLTWDGLAGSALGDGLVVRPLDPPLYAWLALVWRKDKPLSPAALVFLDTLKKVLQEQRE